MSGGNVFFETGFSKGEIQVLLHFGRKLALRGGATGFTVHGSESTQQQGGAVGGASKIVFLGLRYGHE